MFKKGVTRLLILSLLASLFVSLPPVIAAPGDPGKINADSYSAMSGVTTEVCSEGGMNIAYIDGNDWMDYVINVPTTGTYNVELRVASPYENTQLQLQTSGTVLATVNVPNTGGFQNWQTVAASVNLTAGSQTLRVYAVTNGWNFSWLNITRASAPVATNLALNKPVTVLSSEGPFVGAGAVDGNSETRWSSEFSDPQWIAVDLGAVQAVNRVKLNWETAYAKSYQIQVSSNESSWTDVYSTTTGDGGVDDVSFNETNARYVRIYGTQRATAYGYSLWDFEVYGTGTSQQQAAAPTFTPGTGTYLTAQEVTIASATPGAAIKYTTDGSTPTAASAVYVGPITVATSTTVKAISTKAGMADSSISTAVYTINASPVAVTIPVTGPYAQYLEMGLAQADLDQKTTLKTQNTTVNHSLRYNVGTTVTIGVNYMVEQKQVLFKATTPNGNPIQGNPLTFTVQPNMAITVDITDPVAAATPVFAPAAGTYTSAQSVTITSSTEGAVIKYTTDGSTPTAASATYTGPINVAVTTTVKAIAIKAGLANSAVASASYTIGQTAVNLAYFKPTFASSFINGNKAEQATDGNVGTRWESKFEDPQWIYVDLGAVYAIDGVKLNWEAASAKSYKIQLSNNERDWSDVYTQNNGTGGIESINITPTRGRYVRVYGTVRNTGFGYSLLEFEVYGQPTPLPPQVAAPTFTPAGGAYTTAQNVTLTSATAGATIKYTTDGSTPTAQSATYNGAINIAATTTLKAIAIKADMTDSIVSTATYTISDFRVLSPTNEQMVTTTRTPQLTWEAKAGTVKYEVWVNVTRNDYDWNASGNLLDRYTKVGETTSTAYVSPSLVDRWTYKWYVIAVDGTGKRSQSNIGQFSVYLPYIEQVSDGIQIVNGSRDLNKNGTIEPYEDWHNPIATRVEDLMSRMTNEEKINQLFFSPESIDGINEMAGFVFSYGTTNFITDAQKKVAATSRLGIPIAFTGDKIHGWKTVFPTELGMAATRNLALTWQVGDLQRREQKAWGFTGTLSPLAEVNTKVLYPRFQEGTGENADYSAAMLRALIAGMQGGPEVNPKSMLITVKHWPSQGAGGEQSIVYDETTIKWHMKPWYAAMDANMATVMPGYGGAPFLDPDGNGAGTSKPTLDYLRNVIGFKGVVMTDWLAAATDISIKSIGAGSDVMGGAVASGTDFNTLIAAVGLPRLNEAARRVLDLKFRLGMFENPYGDPDYPTTIWHSAESNNIVNEAARQSLTLLKNNGVLPLKPNNGETIIVAGPRALSDDMATDNISNVVWQSIYHDNPAAKSYFQGIKDRAGANVNVALNDAPQAKAAVVVIGEKSYTHGTEWPDKNPTLPADQVAVIDKFYNRNIPVICAIVTPRPYVLTNIVDKCSAIVLLYRPGNGGGLATAQLLFGDYLPTGKLPFQLPRSVDQVGTDAVSNQLEKWDLPYDLGATEAERTQIRNYIKNNQPVPTNFGNPLFPYGFGLQNFNPS
ncbi:chitobiase/beta-hexosaminidase C-terminal domain-containing protein [Paenibacillus sp. NPDC058071]|uniref:chitobiase/beta-hexosaminidase C-terminal domain-containing protein n=1 Tax=Paenibacillus sp. NPDC058071 TaxID=3346326 RepID=UPI0036DE8DEE